MRTAIKMLLPIAAAVMERKMLLGLKQRAERLAARAMPARATA
jgi:hypothetical protein